MDEQLSNKFPTATLLISVNHGVHMEKRQDPSTEGKSKNWIYPVWKSIDERRIATFDPAGLSAPAGRHGFVTRFQSGHFDDRWEVLLNVKHVDIGDRVWLYCGQDDLDMGVVGLGEVTAAAFCKDGRRRVSITWDRRATGNLIRRYSFVDDVRHYIPFVHAFRSLDGYPDLVSALQKAAGVSTASSLNPLALHKAVASQQTRILVKAHGRSVTTNCAETELADPRHSADGQRIPLSLRAG